MKKPESSAGQHFPAESMSMSSEDRYLKQKLQAHLSNSPLAVIEFDQFNYIVTWSSQAERLFGWSADEVIGRAIPLSKWVHEDDLEKAKQVTAEMISNRLPRYTQTNRNYRKDGSVVHCEWYNSAIYDEKGQLSSVLSFVLDITERKMAEEVLRESHEKFKSTFDKAAIPMTLTGLDGRIMAVNPAFINLLEYPESEIIGVNFRNITFPEDLKENEMAVAPVLSGERDSFRMEKRFITKSGRIVWVDLSAASVRGHDGKPLYLVTHFQNISRHKEAEQALKDSEEKYRNVVERANDGIIIVQDGILKYANPKMAELDGSSVEQLVGSPITDHIHPDDMVKVTEMHRHRMAGEKVADYYEALLKRADGRAAPSELNVGTIIYEGEMAALVIIRDITERKRAEEAIKEKEEYLRTALSGAEAGMWVWDLNTEWITTPQINLLFGRHTDTPITFQDFSSQIHPDDFDRIKEEWNKAIQHDQLYDQEYRIRWPDGSIHWLASKGKVFMLPSGKKKFMGISFDITYRKMCEADLQNAKDQLENKVRERTAQLSTINESLLAEIEERKNTERRLLSAKKNLRAMAAEIVLAEERSRQHFSTELHDTVVQTLGASKLRSELLRDYISKKGETRLTELQNLLSQGIKEARQIMAELSPPVLDQFGFIPALEWLADQTSSQTGLDIRFRGKNENYDLSREVQVLLFQAIRELLMNVVKHSKAKKAEISVRQKKESIRITVKDDGIGFHGKVSFREDHTGFGLFSIRERLKHLGGQLIIESQPDRGTRVTIVSPRSIEQ